MEHTRSARAVAEISVDAMDGFAQLSSAFCALPAFSLHDRQHLRFMSGSNKGLLRLLAPVGLVVELFHSAHSAVQTPHGHLFCKEYDKKHEGPADIFI